MDRAASTLKWVGFIQNRIERARQWRMEMDVHRELAKDYRYIRILGKSFRAISISVKNPCGCLIRQDNGKKVSGCQNIASAIRSAMDSYPYDHPYAYPPRNQKPEHKVQAFLIRHALMNGQEMQSVLKGFDDVFEKLIFITDELSVGEFRADIIALGGKNGHYFPVFIELKNKRELTRLKGQLKDAKSAMSENAAKIAFINLLSATSGITADKIKFEDYKLMIVWTSTSGGKESQQVEEARAMGYLFTEFSPENQGYSFQRN
ncbi:MAG: hypothetical protein FJY53_06865 [Betaproteobacteria bacterium]|nr:hypothetical protein [Betaproteobacteria bacterium]